MSRLDDAIGVFSPGWKAARLQARAKIRAYEAVTPTRTHKGRRENRSADQLSKMGAVSLREQARWLDNNHDLVIGVFDKLEERVVGKAGIIVEPHPKLMNGKIAKKLADQIRNKWAEWSVRPDVTNQFTRPMLERLMLRTWLRDGEVFAQLVSGTGNGLTPAAGIPFWLEALEPDFIPMNSDAASQLNQGVFVDNWGRPRKYQVYKSLPVSGRQLDTKEVDAENMLHLKFVRRLHQTRGVSMLSGVLMRLYKIKYPNGTVDVFRGWCSSLGKAIPAKEVITRTAKITNTGKPELAEESGSAPIAVTGVTLDKSTASVAVAATTALNVTVNPASASDPSFRVATSDGAKATVSVSGNTITVTGVAAGNADIIVMTSDGNFVAVCKVTVTVS